MAIGQPRYRQTLTTMEELLTPRELARKLNVPVSWIYDRTRQGGPERIPHYKLGRYLRFAESEVVDYLRIRAVAVESA